MLLFHIAFTLGLIALAAGVALYVWALRADGQGVVLAKVIGFIIITFASIGLLCSTYTMVRHHNYMQFRSSMYNYQQPMDMRNASANAPVASQECPMCAKKMGEMKQKQGEMQH